MTSNANNSEKNNNLAAWAEGNSQEINDDEFFALHPQPQPTQPTQSTLRVFQEDEEEDLLSIMSDVEVDEDYEDEDEGMFNCDECCCFRCCCVPVLSRALRICFVPDGEELVADFDLEAEDQYLYDLKRHDRYPNKSLKTYHEHEPIPMDISDEKEEDGEEVEDGEEEEDGEEVEDGEEEDGEEEEEQEWIIPMNVDEETDRPLLKYQRQTSCWEHNGKMIYNGNPDGSRLYRELYCGLEDDDLSDLPGLLTDEEILAQEAEATRAEATRAEALAQDLEHDLLDDYHANVCDLHYLEAALNRGETLDRWENAKVIQLRQDIAYYEIRQRT
jgi:hypothetical protein